MSDDIRDRCDCDDCKSARVQIHFHSERNRQVREKIEREYRELLSRASHPQPMTKDKT